MVTSQQATTEGVSHLIWHLESDSQAVELICNMVAADGQVGFSHFLVAIAMLDLERWARSISRSWYANDAQLSSCCDLQFAFPL